MNKAKTVLVTLICGLAAGACFGALLSSPRLLTFWFIKGDKFLIPTYRYYLGAGVFLLLGLAAAYTISRMTGLLTENSSLIRKIVSAVVVATSPVIIFAIATTIETQTATTLVTPSGNILLTNIDPITLYLWGIVAFVLLISIACWILTAKLYYIGVFLNLLTLPATFGLLYLVSKVVAGERSELVTYPILFSLLSASSGFWIAAAQRLKLRK